MFFANILRLIRNIYLFAPTIPKLWRGLVSREVPLRLKLIPLLGVIYIFSPLSRLFSGVLDDIFVFFLLISFFISKTRKYFEQNQAPNSSREKDDSQTIEGEYRYKKDND